MGSTKYFHLTEEQKELVEKNHNLIFSYLRTNNLDFEKYYDLAAIGLCLAAACYDESKSKFSTYAYLRMKGVVFKDIMRKNSAQKRVPDYLVQSLNETLYNKNSQDEYEVQDLIESKSLSSSEEIELRCEIDKYLNNLKENDRNIIKAYMSGYTQMEIAKNFNISQPQVSRIKLKFENYLKEILK